MAVPGEVHVLSTVTAVEETMDVTLKDKQREAVASVGFMKGSDVFVSFPTRYGFLRFMAYEKQFLALYLSNTDNCLSTQRTEPRAQVELRDSTRPVSIFAAT